MKILYILKQSPDETVNSIMNEHKASNEVTVVDLKGNKNYDQVIDLIAENDKVISW